MSDTLDYTVPTVLPGSLPVLALRQGALLPGAVVTFNVGRRRSLAALDAAEGSLVLVAAPREPQSNPAPADLLQTATLARVLQRARPQDGDGPHRVLLQGLARAQITGWPATAPYLRATFTVVEQAWPGTLEAQAFEKEFRAALTETLEVFGNDPSVKARIDALPTFGLLIDTTAQHLQEPEEWRRDVLVTLDPQARAEKVLKQLIRARELTAAQKTIKDRIDSETKDMQREFFLKQQLKAIQKELGEDGDADELEILRDRLDDLDLPEEARRVVDREFKRLERLGNGSPERSVAIDWLEWIADLPWNVQSAVDVDLAALEDALDNSHYGLDDVKRQVVEYLSVRKLSGSGRADVLLLVGPPGVGKTSIGQAIADATGRKLVRVALGGMRDEAELRGHRRTYIGARPGRLVEGVRRGGTQDPVVLLDEVDKVGSGVMGNPAAALLEILDPEQNHAFVDRYLEVPFDLSKALFVATANSLENIPGPLRDRMEVLFIEGYTQSEKVVIARSHLLEKVARNAGLEPEDVEITDDALRAAIDGWTREAGVRSLQRVLGRIYRSAAVLKAKGTLTEPLRVDVGDLPTYLKRPRFHQTAHEAPAEPGIATGLAWTPTGGDVLYVEASTLPGNGKLVLTGQLGDVMKESARAALTYVLAHGERLGIPLGVMEDHDVHIHVPAGGVPKDGPSAGVTMFTALASLLSGRPVRDDTAMTGEATLRGRVLPVGGIKSKVLAAHRQGLKRILLPRRNEADLEDVPKAALDELEILLVDHMSEVLAAALTPRSEGLDEVVPHRESA